MNAVGKWILANCRFANRPLVIDWDEVARLIREGLTSVPMAERLHVNPTWLRKKIKDRFYDQASPYYSPELLAKSRENVSKTTREKKQSPIDWDVVLRRINEGAILATIATEQGLSAGGLQGRIKSRFLDPDSPDYNPQIAERIAENASNARSEKSLIRWQDPEFRKLREDEARIRAQDPDLRRRVGEESRARWEQEEYRERMSEKSRQQHQVPGYTEMLHNKARERWSNDPEFAARMKEEQSVRQRALMADPEKRRRQVELGKERFSDPAERARMSELMKRYWENPTDPRHQLQRSNFQEWLAAFPAEKQEEILRAIRAKMS